MSMTRTLSLHGTLIASLVLAAAVMAIAPFGGDVFTRLAIGWDIGVGVFILATLWRMMQAEGADAIRRRAADLDQAGRWVLPLSLMAALASIVVVIGEATQSTSAPLIGGLLSLTTVALSWAFVHLIFALHYAHAFYQKASHRDGDRIVAGAPDHHARSHQDRGGLLFPGEDQPDYWDFLHFSLIIGVASQTADVQIADRGLRRLSTIHSVTAFTFNTVVLALTVNLMVGVVGKG